MIPFSDNWEWTQEWSEEFMRGEGAGQPVRLPHSVAQAPVHNCDERSYQMVSGYRRRFTLPEGRRFFLTFEGAAHIATLYINGREVAEHRCGYTAFRAEITDYVVLGENLVAVRLDSTENPAIPPFGGLIDYLTYGGLYRPARLEAAGEEHISDIFVYTPDLRTAVIRVTADPVADAPVSLRILDADGNCLAEAAGRAGEDIRINVPDAMPWSPDTPVLYRCEARLSDGSSKEVTFGLRTADFRADGLYLNGVKTFMRGLNRHQCYPYVGYAAPDRMQAEDARILKEELCCNAVRTSHYPQSQAFIDACDRLGLLVFTEIPGWQHIGGDAWQDQAVENVREMVLQYRNHPSIVLWGVRINESQDNDALYLRTNAEAHSLDPSRATSGVRYLKHSSLLEDVYSFNDFSHIDVSPGALPKSEVTPDMSKAFLISENNGHMFPTKSFDTWNRRRDHALSHARVQNDALADGQHAGCFGWCMYDYPTHEDFGSGDRVCYHGVLDSWRCPKTAAAVFASQGDERPVLEIAGCIHGGDHPGGNPAGIWALTNADEVRVYRDGRLMGAYSETPYKLLPHGPIPIDDGVFSHEWGWSAPAYRFEAVKDGKIVAERRLDGNTKLHIEAVPMTDRLVDGDTWDMCAVRVRIADANGNTASYVQLPVICEATGPLRVIGPQVVTAEGGMCAIYAGTTGEEGDALLTVSCPGLESVSIPIRVDKKNICI